MELDANDLMLFAKVAEAGSFSRAADQVGLPKSTVSRRIAGLETRLGERLLARSTRKLALTEFGQGIFEHARRLQEETEAAIAYAQHRQVLPRGRLRVTMPPGFSDKLILSTFFLKFCENYPEVRLELDMSPRRVDLLAEQFDLAIRIASSLPDDATLVARRLADMSNSLYASPAYLNRYGRPKTPDELLKHVGLHMFGSSGDIAPWQLVRNDTQDTKNKEKWEGLPDGPLAANAIDLVMQLTSHGLGIALFTDRFAQPAVDAGLLERVLPDWSGPPVTVWGVMPGRKLMPTRTRVFLDALVAELLACSEVERSHAQALTGKAVSQHPAFVAAAKRR
ncbi:LysR family transcriptional regulator [Uliginosibacterium sp. H3]|uniref:LysR family transcriptional regulator n=1 Tax=Uliginosibacterium silvisoli TaxID=3114758 RepID=A0ABU6K3T2_9RHOO|nr:LysR family transcriptional regulator [Uliginosibacterium sp. H3]